MDFEILNNPRKKEEEEKPKKERKLSLKQNFKGVKPKKKKTRKTV